jgi:hypothetical protein
MQKPVTILHKLARWAGVVAPALFVVVFFVEGYLRPGYNPRSMYISALSLGPRGWVQMVNFLVLGLLLGLFAWRVSTVFPTGKASKWGVILLGILAVLFFISGPFVMDPTGTPQNQMTVHGTIHGLAGGFVFLLMPVTIFVFLRRFRVDPEWQKMVGWTWALGVIEAVAVVFFTAVSKSPALSASLAEWMGLIQRLALVPFMLWLFDFGVEVALRSRVFPEK